MIAAAQHYFAQLSEAFGEGWNRFWFTPASPRPLATIRLLTGIVALYWYASLAPDWQRFFGPNGWLPVDAVRQLEGNSSNYLLSYLNYAPSESALWTLYAAGGVVLLAFAAGLFTRLTAPLALIVVLSTVHRAPPISSPAEFLLSLVMFYLALGPAGACLSIDALRKSPGVNRPVADEPPPSLAAGVVTRLLQVHVVLLYGCMGLSKLFAESWWNGMSVWTLITRGDSRLVDLTWLADHPFAVNAWTHGIVLFEVAFALLIWVRLARPLLLGLAVVVWTSTTLLTGQTTFLALILIANLAFCDARFLRLSKQPNG